MPDRAAVRGQVAAEVRAELARQKIPVRRLSRLIGGTDSYWWRRCNGDLALDVEDLAALATLLKVPASKFWCAVRDLNPEPADITERHLVLVEALPEGQVAA